MSPIIGRRSRWRFFAASLNLEDGPAPSDSTSSSSEQTAGGDASENLLSQKPSSDEVSIELKRYVVSLMQSQFYYTVPFFSSNTQEICASLHSEEEMRIDAPPPPPHTHTHTHQIYNTVLKTDKFSFLINPEFLLPPQMAVLDIFSAIKIKA
jgi:hypothetical protein